MPRPWPALALLLAFAAVPLAFRHVRTLDGPLHVLHADHLAHRLAGDAPGGHGLLVDLSRDLPRATDLIALPVLRLAGPFAAQRALVVVSIGLVLLAAWCTVRRMNPANPWATVLVLPVATGQLLVHGFFGFLLGTACALLAWDRWCAWREGARRWTAALGFALAAAWCHRSAPLLLAVLVTLSEGLRQRGPSGRRGWWALGLGVLLVCAAMPVWQALQRAPLEPARTVDPWAAMLGLHPLVLLDAEAERPLLLAIATLLLALWAIALRSGMAVPHRADVILWSVAALMVTAAVFVRTSISGLLYLPDRTLWLALLLFTLGVAVRLPARRVVFVLFAGLCLLHTARLLLLERRWAPYAAAQNDLEAVARILPSNSVVAVAHRGTDWLMHNAAADLCTLHDGLVLAGRGGHWYARGTPQAERMRALLAGRMCDGYWLRHMARTPPDRFVDAVVVLGPDTATSDACAEAWAPTIRMSMDTVLHRPNAVLQLWR
ncbi:MAG: hypothetical protein IPM68_00260 [Flavobacteriales bacterium]|nr:hypothetical protein [Flavobacteriales bacterium]